MKKIFYYTDVLPFLSRENDAISKLEYNLNIFKQNSGEITLVWHPWSCTKDCLLLNNSPVFGRYMEILDRFKEEKWGILDETTDSTDAKKIMLTCNAYYGDTSNLMYDAMEAGLPVMVQNIDIKE